MKVEWTKVSEAMPKVPGQYLCRDGNGKEFTDFLVFNFSSTALVWLSDKSTGHPTVVEWKEKI